MVLGKTVNKNREFFRYHVASKTEKHTENSAKSFLHHLQNSGFSNLFTKKPKRMKTLGNLLVKK